MGNSGFDWGSFQSEAAAQPAPQAPPQAVPQAQASPPQASFNWDDHPTEGAPAAPAQSMGIPGAIRNAWDTSPSGLGLKAGEWAIENVVAPVGKWVDKYTGSPTRAAIDAASDGKGAGGSWDAFKNQFGQAPEKAPTGKQIAQKWGVSNKSLSDVVPGLFSETGEGWKLKKGGAADISASGAAGLGVDIAGDWTNVIPVSAIAKTAVSGAKGAVKGAVEAGRLGAKAADIATGTRIASGVGEIALDMAAHTGELIKQTVNPKIVPTYEQALSVAQKNGINPELLSLDLKYGDKSEIARRSRVAAEGPGGQALLEKHYEGYKEISDALINRIKTISGGEVPNATQAGDIIHDGLKRAQKQLLDKADITYSTAGKYAPGLKLDRDELAYFNSTLIGAERQATALMNRGVTSTQKASGRELMNVVASLRSGANGSYKQAVEALQMLGKAAFDDKPVLGRVEPDVSKMRDLYSNLSEALTQTVRKHINPDFADQLIANNKEMNQFFSDRAIVGTALDPKKAGEKIFQRYVLSGDTKQIEILKDRLAPEEFDKLKGALMQSILRPNADDLISFKQARNALWGKKNQVGAVFEPEEMKDLGELIKLGEGHGIPNMSTSGTGASYAWRQQLGAAYNKKMLEKMQERGTAVAQGGEAKIPSMSFDTDNLGPLARGPREAALKAAQSVAPSTYTGYRANQPQISQNKSNGDDAWTMSGFKNVIKHEPNGALTNDDAIDRAFSSPKVKRLLVQAADLKPGSSAMQKVVDQINQELGAK